MSESVAIHFGTPKTGSTSIQSTLRLRMTDPRFHFVRYGPGSPNHQVITAFAADPGRYRAIGRLGLTPAELDEARTESRARLRRELMQARGRTAILSSEAIYGLRPQEVRDMVDWMRGCWARDGTPRIRAIGYVRPLQEFVESSFQQNLKSLNVTGFEPETFMPNYQRNIEKFDAALGARSVDVWPFDRSSFPDGCVVRDLCRRLGIRIEPSAVIRMNDSLALPAVALLYAYRRFGPPFGAGPAAIQENRRLVARLRELKGPKFRLHSSVLLPMFRSRAKSIAWVEGRVGAPLTGGLTAHDAEAVRGEDDLLRHAAAAVPWLSQALGEDLRLPAEGPGRALAIADGMHRLRLQVPPAAGSAAPAAGDPAAG